MEMMSEAGKRNVEERFHIYGCRRGRILIGPKECEVGERCEIYEECEPRAIEEREW